MPGGIGHSPPSVQAYPGSATMACCLYVWQSSTRWVTLAASPYRHRGYGYMYRMFPRSACLLTGIALVVSTGCVTEPPQEVGPPLPPPETTVYFYPTRGQSGEQQDRDKYECNSWAVQQSGFDPSLPSTPPHLLTRVVAGEPPPGARIAGGAAIGALLGAVIGSPQDTGAGAVAGAIAGAAVGGAAEAASQQERQQVSVSESNAHAAVLERQASNFRRAMAACLEGRGYNVR